jgi:6-pyruvoyltetrahydropterin/6-carboxytetrahydropterin synthase
LRIKVGIEGVNFDSAHYTASSQPDDQIHGHTYIVSVQVEGEVDQSTGFVVDFNLLQSIVREVVREWDHKLIIPKGDYESVYARGPFRLEVKQIDAPFPTAEFIAIELSRAIHKKLGRDLKVTVRLYEGAGKYAEVTFPE